jgi:hypothetical protein
VNTSLSLMLQVARSLFRQDRTAATSHEEDKPVGPLAMVELFEKYVGAELAGDLDTTMETMSDDPHLNHVTSKALFGALLGPCRGLRPP